MTEADLCLLILRLAELEQLDRERLDWDLPGWAHDALVLMERVAPHN